MRVSSCFLVLFAYIALADVNNAAAIMMDKRAISTPVQLCINTIAKLNVQLPIVKTASNYFTAGAGFYGFMALINKEMVAEGLFNSTIKDCSASPPATYSNEEANAVIQSTLEFSTKMSDLLTSLENKKPEFDKVFFASRILGIKISLLRNQTNDFNKALTSKTPASSLPSLTTHFTKLNAAYQTAQAAYPYNP